MTTYKSKLRLVSLIDEFGVECGVTRVRYDDTRKVAWVEVEVTALDEGGQSYRALGCTYSPQTGFTTEDYARMSAEALQSLADQKTYRERNGRTK